MFKFWVFSRIILAETNLHGLHGIFFALFQRQTQNKIGRCDLLSVSDSRVANLFKFICREMMISPISAVCNVLCQLKIHGMFCTCARHLFQFKFRICCSRRAFSLPSDKVVYLRSCFFPLSKSVQSGHCYH